MVIILRVPCHQKESIKVWGEELRSEKSNFMVNPPNLPKAVLFTFNIVVIESIKVLFKLLFEIWNKSNFGGELRRL